MGWKNVTSRDERKAQIMAALKRRGGGTKVTKVMENAAEGLFTGTVLVPSGMGGAFLNKGTFMVSQTQVDAEGGLS